MPLNSLRATPRQRPIFLLLPLILIAGAALALFGYRLLNPPQVSAQSSVVTKPVSAAYRPQRSSASGTMKDGDNTWVYELPCSGAICHIQYVSVEVRLPGGQTAFAELGMPMDTTLHNIGELSTIKLEPLGSYPAGTPPYYLPAGNYFGGNQTLDLRFPAKMGGETTPMPSRHLIVRRSANSGIAYVSVFVAGYVE